MSQDSARRLPWLRILAEGAVIVVSILLALTADAWWEGVQERRTEARYLTALLADVEEVIGEAERTIEEEEERITYASELVAQLRDSAAPSDSALIGMIFDVGVFNTLRSNLDVYSDLVGSGRVTILSDAAVRQTLSELRYAMDLESRLLWTLVDRFQVDLPTLLETAVAQENDLGRRLVLSTQVAIRQRQLLIRIKGQVLEAGRAAREALLTAGAAES